VNITPHPKNQRAAFTEKVLRKLYIEDAQTLDGIAKQFGFSQTTVRRRFRDLGIPARARGPMPRYAGDPRFALGTPFIWSGDIAYIVGLIATDGCLSRNGRTIAITSKDGHILDSVRGRLGGGAIGLTTNGRGHWCYRYQFSNRGLYTWLLDLGLTPAKSLTLGELRIPDGVFRDFVRGCIDGDGSIVTYVDRFNTSKHPKYVYDRLYVSLVSASPTFLRWMQRSVSRLCEISGDLGVRPSKHPRHHDMWRLRYAKRESARLLTWIYYAPEILALHRKRGHAERALAGATWYRHSLSESGMRPHAGVE
jgi:hypothetical protein